jgi:hypothetical protein
VGHGGDITTQIPRVVHLVVPRGRYAGVGLRTPPVKIYRFDVPTSGRGIDVHAIDRVPVRIYSAARTLVDYFKYRSKLGLDVAIPGKRYVTQAPKNVVASVLASLHNVAQEAGLC